MTALVTRSELVTRGVGYLALGASGLMVLIDPPFAFVTPLYSILSIAGGVFLSLALVASAFSFFGRYRVEMVLLPFICSGLLSLSIASAISPTRSSLALILLAFFLLKVIRFFSLMRLARKVNPNTHEIPVVQPGA